MVIFQLFEKIFYVLIKMSIVLTSVNASFLGNIQNLAGQLSNLNVADAEASNLTVDNLTANNTVLGPMSTTNQGWETSTLVAFAPNTFGTATVGTVLNLMNRPRQTPATGAGDDRLVTLPIGTIMKRVQAGNNGVGILSTAPGTTAIDVGFTGVFGSANLVGGGLTGLLSDCKLDGTAGGINASIAGLIRNYQDDFTNGPESGLSIPGAFTSVDDDFLYVLVQAGDIIQGDLRVVVEYNRAITV